MSEPAIQAAKKRNKRKKKKNASGKGSETATAGVEDKVPKVLAWERGGGRDE